MTWLFYFLIINFFFLSLSFSSLPENPEQFSWETDREILINLFKDTFPRSSKTLSSKWLEAGTDHCSWEGVRCANDRVVELHLSNWGLQGSLPQNLGYLDQIKFLDFSYNSLEGEIPSSLRMMKDLETIILLFNKISSINEQSFENKTKMIKIDFSFNVLEKLPDKLPSQVPKLKEARLEGNKLKTIPETINTLTELEYLDLGSNPELNLPSSHPIFSHPTIVTFLLDSTNLQKVPEIDMPKLIKFSLQENSLTEFPLTLLKSKSLEWISLSSNEIKEIPSELNNMKTLKRLECDSCGLTKFPNLESDIFQHLIISNNDLKFLNLTGLPNLEILHFKSRKYIPTSFEMFIKLEDINLYGLEDFPEVLPESIMYVTFFEGKEDHWPQSYFDLKWNRMQIFQVFQHQTEIEFPEFLFNYKLSLWSVLLEGKISGTIPQISKTIFSELTIRGTNVRGTIPTQIGMLYRLSFLEISNNVNLTGPIPTQIMNIGSLRTLLITSNSLDSNIGELEGLNQVSQCDLSNNEPPFTCSDEVLEGHICNVECGGEGMSGTWMTDNICTESLLKAMTNRSKMIINKKNFDYYSEDTVDCLQPQVGYWFRGTFELVVNSTGEQQQQQQQQQQQREKENILSGMVKFHVEQVSIKLKTSLASLLFDELCFNYRQDDPVPPLGVWGDISHKRCVDSGYGYQLWFPGTANCPTYYDLFEFDSYRSTLRFGEGHLFDPKKCSMNNVPQQLGEMSMMTRDWNCSTVDSVRGCTPSCGDGFLMEEDGEECELGGGRMGTESGGCWNCKLNEGWTCDYSLENRTSDCVYICNDLTERKDPNQCPGPKSESGGGTSDTEIGLKLGFGIGVGLILLVLVGLVGWHRKIKNSQKKLIINENELELQELLGQGKFGEVFKGIWRGTTEVAVKVLKENAKLNHEELDSFKKEAMLFMNLPPHPNIVQFLGIVVVGEQNEKPGEKVASTKIVTEYLGGGNLLNYMRKMVYQIKPEQCLSTQTTNLEYSLMLDLGKGIAAGMDHLHQNQIIHRDLAARNILIQGTISEKEQENKVRVIPKISDFGLSVTKKGGKVAIPVRWTAPEVLMNPDNASFKSDVWSFGIVLFEISVAGTIIPYTELKRNKEVYEYVLSSNHVNFPSNCQPNFVSFAKSCFSLTPSLRPSFSQLFDGFKQEEQRWNKFCNESLMGNQTNQNNDEPHNVHHNHQYHIHERQIDEYIVEDTETETYYEREKYKELYFEDHYEKENNVDDVHDIYEKEGRDKREEKDKSTNTNNNNSHKKIEYETK